MGVLVRKIDGYVMRTVGGAMFLVMMVVLSLDLFTPEFLSSLLVFFYFCS